MMNRTLCYSLCAATAISVAVVSSRSAISAGQAGALVRLQATTPGTQQVGHTNVSGTIRAGQFVGGGGGLTGVNADLLDGLNSTAFLQAVPNPLALSGSAGVGSIIKGTNTSTSVLSAGVTGEASGASGTVYGVVGTTASTNGRGVAGFGTSSTGTNYGGYFDSNSPNGYGVFANSAGLYGVFGRSTQTSGTAYGVYGQSDAFTGYAIYGEATSSTGSNYGGRFNNVSNSGGGITAAAQATSGATFGGRFENNSTSGRGVFGWALASSGTTYGVFGKADSPNGKAIYGDAQSGTGGYFQSATGLGLYCATGGSGFAMDVLGAGVSALRVTTTGFDVNKAAVMIEGGYEGLRTNGNNTGVVGVGAQRGVIGIDTGISFGGIGVSGQSYSDEGVGVSGYGGSGIDGTGVRGSSSDYRGVHGLVNNTASGTSYGVYGESTGATARGVFGTVSSTAGVNYGVRGTNSNPSGYGVYSNGDFGVSGNKAFVIDHPFDPENKYLKHYCTEGPEPKNLYDGTVVTDSNGWATVRLPDYFGEINKDPRVQLTVDDSSADFVMVKVVGGVADNSFRLRSSKGSIKVYWEVKATRNDAWNRAHGAPVEVLKSPEEQGKYQHPELYGKPANQAVDYDPRNEPGRKGREKRP